MARFDRLVENSLRYESRGSSSVWVSDHLYDAWVQDNEVLEAWTLQTIEAFRDSGEILVVTPERAIAELDKRTAGLPDRRSASCLRNRRPPLQRRAPDSREPALKSRRARRDDTRRHINHRHRGECRW